MKKARNIGLILGLIILISSNSNAQYYYTSYGNAQNWQLPRYVEHSIYDNYYGYDIAHVKRYNRHGHQNFNVLLHRNGWFVELRFNRHGHIYRTIRHRYNYPLMSHNCTNHCGYHRAYYTTHYPKYHHAHYWNGYHKTVYVNTYGHKKHNQYYSNVHVEKQQNNYNTNNQSSRKTRVNYSNNTNNQQRRTSNVIRKPQQTNTRKVEYKRPQSSSRSQHLNGQRIISKPRSSTTARNSRNYKNERGNRDR